MASSAKKAFEEDTVLNEKGIYCKTKAGFISIKVVSKYQLNKEYELDVGVLAKCVCIDALLA